MGLCKRVDVGIDPYRAGPLCERPCRDEGEDLAEVVVQLQYFRRRLAAETAGVETEGAGDIFGAAEVKTAGRLSASGCARVL